MGRLTALRLPPLSSPLFALVCAVWISAAYNGAFFARIAALADGGAGGALGFALASAAVVLAIFHLAVSLLMWPYVGKAVLALSMLGASVAAYFIARYGVLIDDAAIQSALETDWHEVAELLNASLLTHVLLWGVLPGVAVVVWPVRWAGVRREILNRGAGTAASVLVLGVVAAALFPQLASTWRLHRELALLITPANVVRASHKHFARSFAQPRALEPLGLDATIEGGTSKDRKPRLLVLVIGETARADHFSLGGYEQRTNARLHEQAVTWFPHVVSCGTATAVSLPCMFSDLGRSGFNAGRAHSREGLLDVLRHAGYEVLWRDNNSGCKGVCDRVRFEDLSQAAVSGLCADGECYDGILLHGLQERIDALSGNAVIVLHQKGNHGPAYYLRYPEEFERFTPVCRSPELWRCDRASIINAYDNAILYTDHVIAETIDVLRRNEDRFRVALLYVSDHGESLGEQNVYLHGMPYAIAPEAQKHVPMIVWLSPAFAETQAVSRACMDEVRGRPYSHDNFFHTVISLAGVRTQAYRPFLDIVSGCRDVQHLAAVPPRLRGDR